MMTIDRDMVLVAECRNGQVGGAASLGLALVYLTVQRASRSFWRSFAGLSFQSCGMRPSLIAFVRGVALLGSGDNGGVDDLSTHSKIARRSQRLVEAKKQSVDDFGLLQGFPEGPDR